VAKQLLQWSTADPELKAILLDPNMLKVIVDISSNPATAAAHMKDPEVAAKVQMLVDAGMILPKK